MTALYRHVVRADELRIGDWQNGSDFMARVVKIDPYWTGPNPNGSGIPMHIDHQYIVVNGVVPPIHKDTSVVVWRTGA